MPRHGPRKKFKMKKLFLVFITCLIIQLVLISRWVALGGSITNSERNINLLKEENESLELQIASLVSISAIEERAILAGFTKTIAVEPKTEFSVAQLR